VQECLRDLGVDPREIRHLCLTHAHLDHAGSAGHWAAENPGLTVHLHQDAAPHLEDPERLVASTRRTFGQAHDRLWGEVLPVPAHALRGIRPGERAPFSWLRALPTPGHIGHHMGYLCESDGTLVAGDALGIIVAEDGPVHPPTPPPTLDLAAWLRTLREVQAVGPERAGVSHFGLHRDPVARADDLTRALTELAERVEGALARGAEEEDAAAFHAETVERIAPFRDAGEVERYFGVFSAANDYRGAVRYIQRHPDWRLEA
jgi:glyoxylase-like metal-dependent hydrolase (beta-lactamase superfamily II)